MQYQGNISSRFTNNFEAFTVELPEHLVRNVSSLLNEAIGLWTSDCVSIVTQKQWSPKDWCILNIENNHCNYKNNCNVACKFTLFIHNNYDWVPRCGRVCMK